MPTPFCNRCANHEAKPRYRSGKTEQMQGTDQQGMRWSVPWIFVDSLDLYLGFVFQSCLQSPLQPFTRSILTSRSKTQGRNHSENHLKSWLRTIQSTLLKAFRNPLKSFENLSRRDGKKGGKEGTYTTFFDVLRNLSKSFKNLSKTLVLHHLKHSTLPPMNILVY